MWRKLVLVAVGLSFPAAALAHLCNDVFAQAKDNLAVKVDVRDGQLHIGKKDSFRVYLLNTMDRNIANIKLEVRTGGKFRAVVKPAPTWKRSTVLKTVRRGGKKRYYEVTLIRKAGVPDGRYKIDLHLYNGRNKDMVYKTVDLAEAAGICELPRAGKVKVDGNVGAAEWNRSFMCTGFYLYKKTPMEYRRRRFMFPGNVPVKDQGRFRLSADKDNLYACLGFQGARGAKNDVATLYVAKGLDSTPVEFSVDRLTGKVTCTKGTTGVECKVNAAKNAVELKIPRKLLGIAGVKSFYANFTRTMKSDKKQMVTYWRANKNSVKNPVAYAQFKVGE